MSKKFLLSLVLVFFSFSHSSHSEEKINSKNWANHPEIKAIRALYQTTETLISQSKLSQESKEFDYCEPYVDTERKLFSDSKGNVLKYLKSGGSDDSSVTLSFYYDQTGKLRFVFIAGGAYNGTELEHRIYFDVKGKRIWENRKLIAGPGYPFPDPWPEDDMVLNPKEAFVSKNECENEAGKK